MVSEKNLPKMFFLLNHIKNVRNHSIVLLGLSHKISIKPNNVFCYGVTKGEKEGYGFFSVYDCYFKNN